MPTSARDDQHERRAAIRRLLAERPIGRQAELVAQLAALGYPATQSSVSRDLRQLGAIKQSGRYVLPARDPPAETDDLTSVADFIRGFQASGAHLLVIMTAIGAAQRVALTLDRLNWPEVVGTLSGDDTIFVATRNQASQRRLQRRLGDTLAKVTT